MSGMFNTKIVTLLHKNLDFRSQRAEILSSNIANMSTPGYVAEDLVFEGALKSALHADQPGPLMTTNARHMDGNEAPALERVSAERIQSASPTVDFNGNSVDLDKEMAKMAENQLMFNAATRLMSHQFKLLKVAVTEGR